MVQENRNMKKTKRKSKSKKYTCIAKIGNNLDLSALCVKYRLDNLIKFSVFLDRKYPTWTWFNVFLKETGKQVMSFTKHKRPIGKDG
jgi:hypothetical protein